MASQNLLTEQAHGGQTVCESTVRIFACAASRQIKTAVRNLLIEFSAFGEDSGKQPRPGHLALREVLPYLIEGAAEAIFYRFLEGVRAPAERLYPAVGR